VITDADWPALVREPNERISKLQQQHNPK